MPAEERFRLLTPDGFVTYDIFVLPSEQPPLIKADCVTVVHEASGRQWTVHRTRLVPLDDPGAFAFDHHHRSACLKCGKVEGIADDQVVCPYHGHRGCGLLEPKTP